MTKVCIIGASGKLGRYMVQHASTGATKWWAFAGRRAPANSTGSEGASP